MAGVKISLSRREFFNRCEQGNLVPVYRQFLGDELTPISIFKRLGGPEASDSFLLESVINGERLGRHTFLGTGARSIFRGKSGRFTYSDLKKGTTEEFTGDPLRFLENRFSAVKPVPDHRLPSFYGGAVGFLSYDAIRYYEDIPDENPDPLNQEDAYLIFSDEFVVVDHIKHHVRIVINIHVDEFEDPDSAYDFAYGRMDEIEKSIFTPSPEKPPVSVKGPMKIDTNLTGDEFQDMVGKAREYIKAGDIFQVVLSRRFSFRPEVEAFQIYRALRSINPSPYMYYLNAGPYQIVGSSPEILVQVKDGKVTIRPIAGTRKRGKTPGDDLANERDLLSDTKEIAEHTMLVDLGRNDVGRVSKPGSVRVTEFKVIERYSHVMHIVSNCEGELRDDLSTFDALRYALPAGTVSGAPKIRAMEIIDELENLRRGIYAGCVGYFSYNGDFDTAIAIRTMVMKDGECHLQAGAGIVFDSDPLKECEEVVNKSRGMLRAVRFSRRGLL